MNDARGWTKIARPGAIRVPWYDQAGHHQLAAIDRDRRMVQVVRLFVPEDEGRWAAYLDRILDEMCGGAA